MARLTDEEMIDILEEIAREGTNAAARIAAIKTLKEINSGNPISQGGFAELDELAQKRSKPQRRKKKKTKAA